MGAVSSGGASLTSMPGRLRWIEVATASRYILGETVTRTRTSFSYLERQVTCVVPARHLGQPLLTSENAVWARFAEYPSLLKPPLLFIFVRYRAPDGTKRTDLGA